MKIEVTMQLKIETPNPKQAEFLRSRVKYTAYGGARGGGKSWALRTKAKLLAFRYPGIRILILRRTYADLEQNHIRILAAELKDFGKYNDGKKLITLDNGSTIKFGYLATAGDELQFQGAEFDCLELDEGTQFSEEQFMKLKACLRGVNDFPKRFYITANPGGVGHFWFRRLFIERDFRPGENPEEYAFIQAKVYDNTALMEADPEYVAQLESLEPSLREQWLEGNWNIFAGQYFSSFDRDIHVVEPFPIPDYWRVYATMDYGLDMLCVLWIAVDESGCAWVIKELHKPDVIISDAAELIKSMSYGMNVYITLAPPDLWSRSRDSGITTAEKFRDCGLPLRQCDNSRVFGWLNVLEYLKHVTGLNGEVTSRLRIFSTCSNLIKNLPLLQHDEKNPDDCATEPHEITHAPDALRYFCQHRPISAKPPDMRTPTQKWLQDAKERAIGKKRKKHR